MKKETTIYDIAKEINVSAATVSRALNGHPAISGKMKSLVQAKASELGYRSNKFAMNLRKQKTHTIGVIVPWLNSYFMSTVLAGMEKIANEAGYNLIISQSLELEKKEILNAQTMFSSRVDALLVSVASDTEGGEHFQAFIDKGVPLLFFDRIVQSLDCPNIVIDNVKAGYAVTKHLIEQGCTRIVHATGSLKRNVYLERLEGYKLALDEHGIIYDENLVFESSLTPDSIIELVDNILAMQPRPDAVFITKDNSAVSLIQMLKSRGVKIPTDIAVVGFNNDPITTIIEPNLTTVNYSGKEMGEIAMQNIINRLTDAATVFAAHTTTLQSKLIVRASSLRKTP
jgi:LacI family transcriptional regulator